MTEDRAEKPQGELRYIGFKGFDPDMSVGEVRGNIRRLFDHMYEGSIRSGFFLDFRNTGVGSVVMSAEVVSERPVKDQVELTDNERELEELKARHFEYSETPAPRHLTYPLDAMHPLIDTPEFE